MSETPQSIPGTVSVVIPTLNAEKCLPDLLEAVGRQQPRPPGEVILIDSESRDRTRDIARSHPNTRVEIITNFTHGRARNQGVRLSKGDFVVLMSQDAVPRDERWLHSLLRPFSDPAVAATFSRQVPRSDANPMEQFFLATHFPDEDQVYMQRNGNDNLMFQRDVFFSNVSSAIRRSIARQHPFDETLIMSEDQQFARDVLTAGHSVAYVSNSRVLHSHNYTLHSVFKRYFDSVYSLSQVFPKHTLTHSFRLGKGYALRELMYVIQTKPCRLPYYFCYAASRACAVVLGHYAEQLPAKMAKKLSLHPSIWERLVSS